MKYLFLSALVFFFFNISAQIGINYTEDEISTHNAFLDATMEKIKGNETKAIEGFKACLSKNIKNHAAAFELAKIYTENKNYTEAIRYGKKALSQDSQNKWYQVFMANVYMEAAEYKKAIPILNNLIATYPSDKYYYDQLSFVQKENKNVKGAIATLDALEKIQGVEETTTRKKFELYNSLKNYSGAESELLKLVSSEPGNTRFLENLASFYQNNKKKKEAHKIYEKILEIDPDHARANLELVASKNKGKDGASFLSSLEDVIGNKDITLDDKVKALIPYVMKISAKSDSMEIVALDDLLASLRMAHPKSPKAFAISADFYNQIEQNREAIKWYDHTLKMNDNIYDVWEQLMYVLVEVGDYKRLLSKSENAIDLYPNKVSAYILHAKALKELGKKKEAKSFLQEARMIAGKNPEYLQQINDLEKGL